MSVKDFTPDSHGLDLIINKMESCISLLLTLKVYIYIHGANENLQAKINELANEADRRIQELESLVDEIKGANKTNESE